MQIKSSFKIITCIIFSVLFCACSTQKKTSKPLLLENTYQERGISINQLGQLEPETLTDHKIINYYWLPHGKFEQGTLNYHYSVHYTGMILTIIEKNNKLLLVTPDSPIKASKNLFSALPRLNQELALSIQPDSKFILNVNQLTNEESLKSLTELIKDSNNDNNIQVLYKGPLAQILRALLPANVSLITHLPSTIKTTHLDFLSLCQSLNDDVVIGSYLTHQARLELLKKGDINFAELVQALPHDADFTNLKRQQNFWLNGQYQKFDGKVAKINQQQPEYIPKKSNLSLSERDKQSIEKQEKLTIKISQ